MKPIIAALCLLPVAFVYGQTTGERLASAGRLYVQKIPQGRVFLVKKQIEPIPDWSAAATKETSKGDVVEITTSLKVMGSLIHFADLDEAYVDIVNQKLTDLFKSNVAASVTFQDDVADKGSAYFLLELQISESSSLLTKDVIVARPGGKDYLYTAVEYKATLWEMAAGAKKPKSIVRVSQMGSDIRVDSPATASDDELTAAVDAVMKKLGTTVESDLAKMNDKSGSKIAKALSK